MLLGVLDLIRCEDDIEGLLSDLRGKDVPQGLKIPLLVSILHIACMDTEIGDDLCGRSCVESV